MKCLRARGFSALFAAILASAGSAVFFAEAGIAVAAVAASVSSPYVFNFSADGLLKESGAIGESSSPYWWVNSGAYMPISGARGHTNAGDLPSTDSWRLLYATANPVDTDNGYHPQNIFRLVTRSKWQNLRQEAYFKVDKNNLSSSPNRNASNGLLLFNRYVDSNNLYYTGVRVDGAAIIKKKQNGKYYTLASTPGIYPGTYNASTKPNLIPTGQWIGLRSEVVNNADGSVRVSLYTDKNWNGVWQKVAEVIDNGQQGTPIRSEGYGGIRTDFMDVTFDQYKMVAL